MSDQDPFTDALRDWVEASMHRSMHAFIRYIRSSALSFSQVNTLFRLYHRGPCPVNDLAEHLGISMAAVSQLLAPLEENGLIERSEDPGDRRVKLITLTNLGNSKVQEGMRARHTWIDELAELISHDERDEILPSLILLNEYSQKLKEQLHHHGTEPCADAAKNESKQ